MKIKWMNKIDEKIWWIKKWKMYLFNWYKADVFVNILWNNIEKQWEEVCKFIFKNKIKQRFKEDLYYNINNTLKEKWLKTIQWKYFNNKISKYKEYYNLFFESIKNVKNKKVFVLNWKDEYEFLSMIALIEKLINDWIKYFIIDWLKHYKINDFKSWLIILNDLVKKYNITVFILWDYSNSKKFDKFYVYNKVKDFLDMFTYIFISYEKEKENIDIYIIDKQEQLIKKIKWAFRISSKNTWTLLYL